ncbi:MAG: hypothetical protein WCI88_03705 [Chloroflexota bacterium]
MKPVYILSLLVILIVVTIFPVAASDSLFVIPTFTVTSVVPNQTVTILTANFPANDVLDVFMGYYGTQGINGIKVATVNSGLGGSFTASFNIPPALQGQGRIAVRVQSPYSGYYAYNWFNNDPNGGQPYPGPTPMFGIPTFSITSVVKDQTVSIITANFPPNDTYDVLMGPFGNQGINGIKVGTLNSGVGGSFPATFNIPPNLFGSYQIAIRLQSPMSGYYSYNWFYNNPNIPPGPIPGPIIYVPSFNIISVVRGASVTIMTANFPPNDSYDVYMGAYGTAGVNGIKVATISSGTGGNFNSTFNIPLPLAGSDRISIRLLSPISGYYSYNWFYNNTYP